MSASGGIRTLTVRVLNPLPLPVGIPRRVGQRNLGSVLWKRLRRLVTLGVLAAAVAAFRSWRLNSEEEKFNR